MGLNTVPAFIAAQNGFNNVVAGPLTADGYPGFADGNAAAQTALSTPNSRVSVLPWNLNTNTVTITAWVNPNGPQGQRYQCAHRRIDDGAIEWSWRGIL